MIRVLASNVVIHASAAIAPAIALAILLRRVGFGEFGAVLACQTAVALFVGVSDLGCSIVGLHRVARRHHVGSLAASARGVQRFMAFRFTSAVLGGTAVAAYLVLFQRDRPALILPSLGLFVFQALTPTWALLALEITDRVALRVVAARAAWLGLAIALVHESVTYLWLVVLLNAALLLVTVRALERELSATLRVVALMKWRRFRAALRSTVSFSLSRISVHVYQAAPLLILSNTASATATGIYATIETIHKVYATASHPITDALFGRTSRVRSFRPFVQFGVPLLFALYVSIAIVAAESPLVLSVIGGGSTSSAAPQLRLILIATVLSVTSLFVGYPLAGGLGRVDAVNRTTFVSPFVLLGSLPLALWLSRDPLLSAIVALICAEGAVLALRIGIVRSAFRAVRIRAVTTTQLT